MSDTDKKLQALLKAHPELKKYAVWYVENDNICFSIDFDWKTFDIAFNDYFFLKNHPEDENAQVIDKFYENVWLWVAGHCNEDQEYTIDCWKDRYTVRKIDEIESIHYSDMTDDEKKEYDERKEQEAIDNKRGERDMILRTVVDPIICNQIRWAALSEEEQGKYKKYRQYLLDIPQQPEFPNIDITSFENFE